MTIARLVALTAAALLALAGPVAAQSVEAEALFREAKELLKQGKLAEACAKFEASDRLEPSVGTELNAADCHERNGRHATAWALFLKAAANANKAGNDRKREAEARRRAALLQPKLSYLTISVAEPSRVTGLVIRRNNDVVDPALWNTGIPVDVGEYEISGQAPGHEAWSTRVTVGGEGDKKSVEVPRFKEIEALVNQPPPVTPATPVDDGSPRPARERPGTFTTMRKVAVGVAAIGLGGVGGTIVFGLRSNDLQRQAEARCPDGPACADAMGVALNEDARRAARLSNVMLGIGVVGIGGAVALWFLGAPADTGGEADDKVSIVPVVRGGELGLSLSGRF